MSRGERRARTEAIVARRVRVWREVTGREADAYRAGRSRTLHPLDCGNPDCFTCHGEKLLGRRPIRDRRQEEIAL